MKKMKSFIVFYGMIVVLLCITSFFLFLRKPVIGMHGYFTTFIVSLMGLFIFLPLCGLFVYSFLRFAYTYVKEIISSVFLKQPIDKEEKIKISHLVLSFVLSFTAVAILTIITTKLIGCILDLDYRENPSVVTLHNARISTSIRSKGYRRQTLRGIDSDGISFEFFIGSGYDTNSINSCVFVRYLPHTEVVLEFTPCD